MKRGKQVKADRAKLFPYLLERDRYECVVTGSEWSKSLPCWGHLDTQHRGKVGSGGSGLDSSNGPAAVVLMCRGHNGADADGGDFRKACLKYGWSVESWVPRRHDMSRVPIRYWDGWFLLSAFEVFASGKKKLHRHAISENTAAELMNELYGEESQWQGFAP
jgi:hypothetical protein